MTRETAMNEDTKTAMEALVEVAKLRQRYDDKCAEVERLKAEAAVQASLPTREQVAITHERIARERAAVIVEGMAKSTQPAHDIVLLNKVADAIRADKGDSEQNVIGADDLGSGSLRQAVDDAADRSRRSTGESDE